MFRSRRVLISISVVVVALFIWCFCGVSGLAHAAQVSYKESQTQKTNGPKPKSPEEQFEAAVKQIETVLADSKRGVDDKKKELKALKKNIDQWDKEIRKSFDETEKKLKKAKLSPEIMQRHYDFVKFYEDNLKVVQHDLGSLEPAKFSLFSAKKDEIETIRNKTKALRARSEKKIKTFDPNVLPHRTRELKRKNPRLKKEEFEKDFAPQNTAQEKSKPILLAATGPLNGILPLQTETSAPAPNMLLAQATNQPGPDDLAETIEVKFTPDIVAKAAELNHDPVKIYNWVRNNIEFVPTWGSIQGAQYCLETMQGNAFDISSLLIALLRASGIHARYVMGTVEIPMDQVMNWVGGFTDPQAALDFMASGGIPVTWIGKDAAMLEHVWVEAYIDYIPSRGAKHKTGQGDTWIDLDASFKQYNYTQGIDIKTIVPIDAKAIIEEIKSTATIDVQNANIANVNLLNAQQKLQDYQTILQNYISQNYPNATVGDILGKKEIVKQEFQYLLGTQPYKQIVIGAKHTEILNNLRHKITFKVEKDVLDIDMGTPINVTISLPELAGKKITLSYAPATAQDEAVINACLPKPHPDGTPIQQSELPASWPAYAINLMPEFKINGTVFAVGTPLRMGENEIFTMSFYGVEATDNDVITNEIKAGNFLGIALDLGKISKNQIEVQKTRLEQTRNKLEIQDISNLSKDDMLGDMLYSIALSYLVKVETLNKITAKNMDIAFIFLPSESIFSLELKSNDFLGIPHTVSGDGLAMDADRLLLVVKALNGDKAKSVKFMLESGINSSVLEHLVPEQCLSTPRNPTEGISAVKALSIANEQGIPIYIVNSSNVNTILPQLQLDSGTISEIRDAVNGGKQVTVSKTNINYKGWVGCGYIVIDLATGAGAYMISGGMNGSWLFYLWVAIVIITIIAIVILAIASGVVAAIAAALVTAFTEIAGFFAVMLLECSIDLWLLLQTGTSVWAILFLLVASGYECWAVAPPSPPDEITAMCGILFALFILLQR